MRGQGEYIGCEISPREWEALDRMKAQTGLVSDANLIRTALYNLAAHLDLAPERTLFAIRVQHGKPTRREQVS